MDLNFAPDNHTRGFIGTFDGNGHYIKGMTIGGENDGDYGGMFGLLGDGAVVKNVAFIDAVLDSASKGHTGYMNGFLAYQAGDATIDNVLIHGYIKRVNGGSCGNMLIGYNGSFSPTVKNSLVIVTKNYQEKGTGYVCDVVYNSTNILFDNFYTNNFYGVFPTLNNTYKNKNVKELIAGLKDNYRYFNKKVWTTQTGSDGEEYVFFKNCLQFITL